MDFEKLKNNLNQQHNIVVKLNNKRLFYINLIKYIKIILDTPKLKTIIKKLNKEIISNYKEKHPDSYQQIEILLEKIGDNPIYKNVKKIEATSQITRIEKQFEYSRDKEYWGNWEKLIWTYTALEKLKKEEYYVLPPDQFTKNFIKNREAQYRRFKSEIEDIVLYKTDLEKFEEKESLKKYENLERRIFIDDSINPHDINIFKNSLNNIHNYFIKEIEILEKKIKELEKRKNEAKEKEKILTINTNQKIEIKWVNNKIIFVINNDELALPISTGRKTNQTVLLKMLFKDKHKYGIDGGEFDIELDIYIPNTKHSKKILYNTKKAINIKVSTYLSKKKILDSTKEFLIGGSKSAEINEYFREYIKYQ